MISIVDSVDFDEEIETEEQQSFHQINKLFSLIDVESDPRAKVAELANSIKATQLVHLSDDDKSHIQQAIIKLLQKLILKVQSLNQSTTQNENESTRQKNDAKLIESYLESINICMQLMSDTSVDLPLNLRAELLVVAVRYSLIVPRSINQICPEKLMHYIEPPTFSQSITRLALQIEQHVSQSRTPSVSSSVSSRGMVYASHLTTLLTYLRTLMRTDQPNNDVVISIKQSGYRWKNDDQIVYAVSHIVGTLIDSDQSIKLSEHAHHLLAIVLPILDDFLTANKVIGAIILSNLIVSLPSATFTAHWPLLARSANILISYRDDEELMLATIPLISDIICCFSKPQNNQTIKHTVKQSNNQSSDVDGQYALMTAYLDEFVYLSLSPSLEKRVTCLLFTQQLVRMSIVLGFDMAQHLTQLLPALCAMCDFITSDVRQAALHAICALIDCCSDRMRGHSGQLIDHLFSLRVMGEHQLSIIRSPDASLWFEYSSKLGETRNEAEAGWKTTLELTNRMLDVISRKWPETASIVQKVEASIGD